MLIRCIDFETTGLPDKTGSKAVDICEVGWCDLSYDRDSVEIAAPQSRLCCPACPIEPEASAVHHLRDVDIIGVPPSPIALNEMSTGVDTFCAHNVEMERAFFDPGERPILCTYRGALRIWPDAPGHSLQTLRYWLKLDDDPDFDPEFAYPAHRAAGDAYCTAFVLGRLLGEAALDDLMRWSKGPALLIVCFLKKYKGVKWHDVPSDYLQWITERSDIDDINILATAKFYLRKRGLLKG